MAEEDDDWAYQLARGYAETCRQIDRKADGYIDWAKSQYARNDVVVYTVWPNNTKPHGIDYELLQDTPSTFCSLLRLAMDHNYVKAVCRPPLAAMMRAAIAEGNKKVLSAAPWDKVKYDRQIVAIAKVAEATAIYSDDKGIRSIAKSVDIPVISFADLPLPPETAQKELPLGPPPKDPNDVDIEEELKQEIPPELPPGS